MINSDYLLSGLLDAHLQASQGPSKYEDTPWENAHKKYKNSRGEETKIAIVDAKIDFTEPALSHIANETIYCIEQDTNESNGSCFDPPDNLKDLHHGTHIAKIISAKNHFISQRTKPKRGDSYTGPAPNAKIINFVSTDNCYQTVTSSITLAIYKAIEYNKVNPNSTIDVLLLPCTENPNSPKIIGHGRKRRIKHSYKLKEDQLLKFEKDYSSYKALILALNSLDKQGTIIISAAGNYYDKKTEGFTAPAAFSYCFTIGAAIKIADDQVRLIKSTNRTTKQYIPNEYPYFLTTLSPTKKAYPSKIKNFELADNTPMHVIDSTSSASAIFAGIIVSFIGIKKAIKSKINSSNLRTLLDNCTELTSDGYKILNINQLYQQ